MILDSCYRGGLGELKCDIIESDDIRYFLLILSIYKERSHKQYYKPWHGHATVQWTDVCPFWTYVCPDLGKIF